MESPADKPQQRVVPNVERDRARHPSCTAGKGCAHCLSQSLNAEHRSRAAEIPGCYPILKHDTHADSVKVLSGSLAKISVANPESGFSVAVKTPE
jgi:hypothetical protein